MPVKMYRIDYSLANWKLKTSCPAVTIRIFAITDVVCALTRWQHRSTSSGRHTQ